ncbi:DUF5060 domain-containing protein [Flavobacteriaceae bacterium GSB9]|nr:DUF5060 domain-containing protein [Flavobacteriaceae bacterium GSB9]
MKVKLFGILVLCLFFISCNTPKPLIEVGLYATFEKQLENKKPYSNKFTDVELSTTFVSPSGKTTTFYGFYDGDGQGGGDAVSGTIWKIRFMPNELGKWTYTWRWSDDTIGGEGAFLCTEANARKGILKAYKENPRWFAYNGTEPVWLKSYYESGHASIAQPFNWITENVYQPIIDRGYNHLQVNWLLSLCCFEQYYHDGPKPTTQNLTLYEEGKASSTMRLDVWKMMEMHVRWLNKKDIGLHMFLGFDGSKNDGPKWINLNDTEKEFYVRYVVSRLAPYANIAGWGYVWEVPGNRVEEELGWAQLVKKYDVFNHLRTYEDEHPVKNEYHRDAYNFAAVENHSIFSEDRDTDRPHWKEPWTHHDACLAGYVKGKPVYMIEGNALWRRFWQKRTEATLEDLRQSAWACVTAGASFNWCGHAGEESLVAFGDEGLPFFGVENPYAASAKQLDILSTVMTKHFEFFKMQPSDTLLSNHNLKKVWCLSEEGKQYLVFSSNGNPFSLQLPNGTYSSVKWLDAKTGSVEKIAPILNHKLGDVSFSPPHTKTDWVLILKAE